MENAVIYPRYSSHDQNDMTIEGQIRICTEFAHSRGAERNQNLPRKSKKRVQRHAQAQGFPTDVTRRGKRRVSVYNRLQI